MSQQEESDPQVPPPIGHDPSGNLYMDQDPRLFNFVEKALSLLECIQQTSPSGCESMKPSVQAFSTHLTKAKMLLLQEWAGPMIPMRADVRDLVVQVKRGILEFLRYFDVHQSVQYTAFIAAKQHVDAFLTDPRVTTFMQRAIECVELLQHLPDANTIQIELHDLYEVLVNMQNILTHSPERAYEEDFAPTVEKIVNGLAHIAGRLPDFATSDVYETFRPAAFQAGLFLVGLPFVSEQERQMGMNERDEALEWDERTQEKGVENERFSRPSSQIIEYARANHIRMNLWSKAVQQIIELRIHHPEWKEERDRRRQEQQQLIGQPILCILMLQTLSVGRVEAVTDEAITLALADQAHEVADWLRSLLPQHPELGLYRLPTHFPFTLTYERSDAREIGFWQVVELFTLPGYGKVKALEDA